jgi:methane/ammonia monooxygenase subunit B
MKLLHTTLLAIVVTVIAFGSLAPIMKDAFAHGVQAQLQSRFVKIEDETFSATRLITKAEFAKRTFGSSDFETLKQVDAMGCDPARRQDVLIVTGRLVSQVKQDLNAWISLFTESTNAGNRWEFISRDPPGNVFTIPGGGEVPYKLCLAALEPGTYHAHTQLNVASVGPGLGPGMSIVVEGEPTEKPMSIANIAYQTILIAVGLGISFATRPWQVI